MKTSLILALALLVASPSALGFQAAVPIGLLTPSTSSSSAEVLTADTPRTTPDGNGFTAPNGWSMKEEGTAIVLTAPEGNSHVAVVDVGSSKDADAAVAAAWAAYDAKATWPLKQASDRLVRDGWEQVRGYAYATPVNDERTVFASARRRGARWTVTIFDLANAVGEKRDAQIELIGRILPKGYSRENFAGKQAHKLDATRLEALKRFVEDARRQFDVPGVAIGIVQDGKVVLAEGFGLRTLGEPGKVDASTLFMIASNTKALTTLMLAKLIEAGKFTWETPATQVLPTFKLGDAKTTDTVLMKHLVCACTGMPRQDMESIFEGERLNPGSVVATLATMQPTSPFGELYQYSNLMADAAGFAGAYAMYPKMELGAGYDRAMQELVFDPLEMDSTTFDFARAQRGNHAAPHGQTVEGETVPASMELNASAIPTRPDGGAWSNVNDMLRYVQMELAKGKLPSGQRYIAETPLLARRAQQVATGSDSGYGMGLKIDRSMGTQLVQHGGVAFGFISNMMWLPEHNVGAVILTNTQAGGIAIRNLFRRRWIEVLFDANPEAAMNVPVEAQSMKDSVVARRKHLEVPADKVWAGKLASRYSSKTLGDIVVSREGGTTWFDFGGWKSEVATRRGDDGTATFVTISPNADGFTFLVDSASNEQRLVLRDQQHEYVFTGAP